MEINSCCYKKERWKERKKEREDERERERDRDRGKGEGREDGYWLYALMQYTFKLLSLKGDCLG